MFNRFLLWIFNVFIRFLFSQKKNGKQNTARFSISFSSKISHQYKTIYCSHISQLLNWKMLVLLVSVYWQDLLRFPCKRMMHYSKNIYLNENHSSMTHGLFQCLHRNQTLRRNNIEMIQYKMLFSCTICFLKQVYSVH